MVFVQALKGSNYIQFLTLMALVFIPKTNIFTQNCKCVFKILIFYFLVIKKLVRVININGSLQRN